MGKIVVKKVQSQNSTVAFQLPASDGTSGQILKTDGSAGLGWTSQNSFKSTDGSSLTYLTPTSTGTSGENLVNNSTSGNIQLAYSSAGNPMNAGTHQGWRIFDKYNFNSGGDTNYQNSVNLICPTSYTTTASNIIAMRLEFYGLSINQGGTSSSYQPIPICKPIDQAGNLVSNTSAQSGNAVSWSIPGQGGGAKYFSTAERGFTQGLTGNRAGTLGNTDYHSQGGKKTYSSYNYKGGGLMMQMQWYNAYGFPGVTGNFTGSYTTSNGNQGWNQTTMRVGNDVHSFHNSTAQHAMGFQVREDGNNYFTNGCMVLSGFFKDGVVN